VKQALPGRGIDQVDPFLLLHHGRIRVNPDAAPLHQGVGPHPHRGFSPVSFIIEGEVHHRDSRGNDQIASQGEVQWMHAGAGIIHSERPSNTLVQQGGTQEVVQLWINTPATQKMNQPDYQHVPVAEIPTFKSADGIFSNKLIAGHYLELEGNIQTQSDLLIIWSESPSASTQQLAIPDGFSVMIYTLKGSVSINESESVGPENLMVIAEGTEVLSIDSEGKSEFLLLAGSPLEEKVVQHGPFVMNSTTEILEAMRDYQMGKMGILIEE